MKAKKQDFSFQIMIVDNTTNDLLIDMYFDTIERAKHTFDCIVVSGVKPGLKIELYFRYYYYYDRDPKNIIEVCNHELIESQIIKF